MSPSKCFYKVFEKQRALHFPNGTSAKIDGKDADVVSIRKLVSDVLAQNGVDPTLRAYILGHQQKVMTHRVYEEDPPLEVLFEAMMCLEELFNHIKPMPLNARPIEHMKHGSRRGRPRIGWVCALALGGALRLAIPAGG